MTVQDAEQEPDVAEGTDDGGTDDGGTDDGGTGDERVDAALLRLDGLDELPLAAQVTVFDDVHRLLQDALTGADADAPSGTGTPER